MLIKWEILAVPRVVCLKTTLKLVVLHRVIHSLYQTC